MGMTYRFELDSALNIVRVTDEQGNELPHERLWTFSSAVDQWPADEDDD